jgi:DNA-binding NarL/FixJ family response regulator
MITIGIIDNYAIIRLGLNLILNQQLENPELLEADSISEFYVKYADKECDVLILGNNSAVAQECFDEVTALRKYYPLTPVIVYDENIDQNLTVGYFELRAQGYISKQNIAGEIVNGIKAVMNRKQFLCPVLLQKLLKFVTNDGTTDTGVTKVLTARESEIATYLSQGMRTSWIADTLGRKPSTISTIKGTIFRKMKVENVVQLKNIFGIKDTGRTAK